MNHAVFGYKGFVRKPFLKNGKEIIEKERIIFMKPVTKILFLPHLL